MTNEIEKGKSVRGSKLVPGTDYRMRLWGKTPVYSDVKFLGIGDNHVAPEGMLKELASSTVFHFLAQDGSPFVVRPGQSKLVLTNEQGEPDESKRVTFAIPTGALLPQEPVTESVAADEAQPAPEAPSEVPVAEEPAPKVESAKQRKRREAAERKAAVQAETVEG